MGHGSGRPGPEHRVPRALLERDSLLFRSFPNEGAHAFNLAGRSRLKPRKRKGRRLQRVTCPTTSALPTVVSGPATSSPRRGQRVVLRRPELESCEDCGVTLCYTRTAECQLERKWLQIAIDTTQPTACDAVHLLFFIISPYSSWASHPIPYYAHPARNQRSRCAPRAPHCLLPCSYLAPTLLQPTLLLSSSYLPPTATTCATVVRTTLAIEEKKPLACVPLRLPAASLAAAGCQHCWHVRESEKVTLPL